MEGAAGQLSGGNQQKVVLARWLALASAGTAARRADAGRRRRREGGDLPAHPRDHRPGVAVLMISSELPEVLGMSDRILVLREGRVAGVLPGQGTDERTVMALATGVEEQDVMSVDGEFRPAKSTEDGPPDRIPRNAWRERVGRMLGAKETGLAAVLVVIVLFLAWRSPHFLTTANLTVVSRQIALALFISIGMTFVILSGAIDLSVGSVVALVSVTVGQLMVTSGLHPVAGHRARPARRRPRRGVQRDGRRVHQDPVLRRDPRDARDGERSRAGDHAGAHDQRLPKGFLKIGQGFTWGVPNPVWLAALVAVVAHLVLSRTTFGPARVPVGQQRAGRAAVGHRCAPHEDPHLSPRHPPSPRAPRSSRPPG